MRTWNRFFLFCLFGTVFLGVAIIFFPRYLSRKLDLRQANQITMVSRDNFSFLEQGEGTVMDHVKVFRNLRPDSEGLTLITSVTDSERVNDEILQQVYEQAVIAADSGMIPWVGFWDFGYSVSGAAASTMPYEYWGDQIRFARYYSLAYDSETNPNTKELLNFWILRFSDNETFDYYFLVDAITFRIYYAEIYNNLTDLAASYWSYIRTAQEDGYSDSSDVLDVKNYKVRLYDSDPDFIDSFFWFVMDQFSSGCQSYYGADDYKNASSGNHKSRISLVVLNYGQEEAYEAAYIEQKVVDEPLFETYQGISIGLQGIDTSVRALLEE